MKLYILLFALLFITSCKTEKSKNVSVQALQDSIALENKQLDNEQQEYHRKIEKQFNLASINDSDDSLQIRLWEDDGLYPNSRLFILRLKDTSAYISYHEISYRQFAPEKDQHKWNPYTDPKVDSVKSFVTIIKDSSSRTIIDSVNWNRLFSMPSQNEIEGSFGALDGEIITLTIAKRNSYKILYYNNPRSSYNDTKEPNHKLFLDYMEAIYSISAMQGTSSKFNRYY